MGLLIKQEERELQELQERRIRKIPGWSCLDARSCARRVLFVVLTRAGVVKTTLYFLEDVSDDDAALQQDMDVEREEVETFNVR
ncbi:hypothetical protein GOP47_0023909 [Adiantum capillus-veneris]|uniref:Uncharacterized protein n=1 Tax=Adiantum capillus-veneris TaxID=13818 RepID=A0A9D4Z4W7_ADICA|nr:hypothetical protein GOP47_0023909 [Adiantum capillus-veneris]